MSEVRGAVEPQAENAEEITAMIKHTSGLSQEISSSVEQMSASVEQQASATDQVARLAENLNRRSDELAEQIAVFRTTTDESTDL